MRVGGGLKEGLRRKRGEMYEISGKLKRDGGGMEEIKLSLRTKEMEDKDLKFFIKTQKKIHNKILAESMGSRRKTLRYF